MSGLTRSVVLPTPLQSVTQMRSNVQMVIVFQPVIYVMVRYIVDGMKSPVSLLKVIGRGFSASNLLRV